MREGNYYHFICGITVGIHFCRMQKLLISNEKVPSLGSTLLWNRDPIFLGPDYYGYTRKAVCHIRIRWWDSNSGTADSVIYPFIVISSSSTRSGITCWGPIYRSNRSVWTLLGRNTWYHITVQINCIKKWSLVVHWEQLLLVTWNHVCAYKWL